MSEPNQRTFLGATISRRTLLSSTAIVGGAALVGCSPTSERRIPEESSTLAPAREPLPPADLGPAEYLFFTDEEAAAIEAMVARIIPGDEDDPGALQAGVPIYIDRMLEQHEGFAEPTYTQGPFAEGYAEGEEPPTGPDTVPVLDSELDRYGHQSRHTPQELYRQGLAGVDRYAQTRHGSLFAELSEEQQDELLMVMDAVQQRGQETTGAVGGPGPASGEGEGGGAGPSEAEMDQAEAQFGEVDPGSFFDTVRLDTIDGMFSDPMYGGNRNLVGWTLIGWPAAQRSYSPQEMLYGTDKQPQSMEGLTPMNPDRAGGGRQAIEQPRQGVHNH